ncbi:MAG TPA: YbhB/YbcL family Raf kinase inhibitor-like protein [Thermotoga sp.]|nr:YbhB/YbcL family Raf kinase inhibitor-like protein [Thermotoga sp.]
MKKWIVAISLGVVIVLVLIFFTYQKPQEETTGLTISSVFKNNEVIPKKYTCEGENVSPPLQVSSIPKDTKCLAIIVDDPDAPVGTFVHWVAWSIPPVEKIPEGIPKKEKVEKPLKMVQGRNDFGKIGYDGPCPPRGHGVHHYHFKIYALDTLLDLPPGSTKKDLEKAMKGHVICWGELIGTFERR